LSLFHVIGRDAALEAVRGSSAQYIDAVAEAYILHAQGLGENPPSRFLRIPNREADRAIALPAYLGSDRNVWGLKWISSVPNNVPRGIPRASGVVILNDGDTGVPFACVDASVVNAVRTAASAAIAAKLLSPRSRTDRVLGIVGAGYIAESVTRYLIADGWEFEQVRVFDLNAERMSRWQRDAPSNQQVAMCSTPEAAVDEADVVILATTASAPYLHSLRGAPLVLHLSLRDIGVGVIASAQNVVDDVDMAVSESTSLHLAEIALHHRKFVDGTIVDLMTGIIQPDTTRPRIFSPFGMGILDIAVAHEIYRHALARGSSLAVSDFCGNPASDATI